MLVQPTSREIKLTVPHTVIMNFFTRLRHLAGKVEKDVLNIQASLNEPIKQRDSSDNRALVILRRMQEDVHNSLEEAQQIKQCIDDNTDFAPLVTMGRTLLERETEIYEETVAYLEQYGYVPMGTAKNKEGEKVEKIESDTVMPPHMTPPSASQSQTQPTKPTETLAATQPTGITTTPVVPLLSKYARAVITASEVVPSDPCTDNGTPSTPEFTTPCLQRYLQKRPTTENDDATTPKVMPVPPVIQTPGFRQLGTPQDDPVAAAQMVSDILGDLPAMTPVNNQKPSERPAFNDSPQMPELNFTIQDLRKMTSQAKFLSADSSSSSLSGTAMYDVTIQNSNPVQPTTLFTPASCSQTGQFTAVNGCNTPEIPELTFNLASYLAAKSDR